jgi:hypothetical protein
LSRLQISSKTAMKKQMTLQKRNSLNANLIFESDIGLRIVFEQSIDSGNVAVQTRMA